MMVYYAHPIDFIDFAHQDEDVWSRVDRVADAIAASGNSVFDPQSAYLGPVVDNSGAVGEINRMVLEIADVVVALVVDPRGSFGVPMEIGMALANKKPLILVTVPGEATDRSVSVKWAAETADHRIEYSGTVHTDIKLALMMVEEEL